MSIDETKLNHSQIIDRLCGCGYHTYVVGGATRDMLSGKDPEDVDIATNATAEEIEILFQGHHVMTVGKSFGVVLVDGYEVATFRHDRYAGLHDKACQVTFVKTIEEDLSRRDLTINAMAFCDQSGDLIDPYNGREDLKKRIIRFVGNPKERIYEDPNRIVRACRFLARIDGSFYPETFNALKENGHYVRNHVAPERVRIEIMKALKIRKASRFFYALHDIGVLQYIFPSMEACYSHPHGPHHLEDVFDHLMICGDAVSIRYPLLKLAGYLHDVGKPVAYEYNPEKGYHTFYGHAGTGSRVVREELGLLRFSNSDIDQISTLVGLHMRVMEGITPKAARRMLKTLNEHGIGFSDLLRLRLADRQANLAKRSMAIADLKDIIHTLEAESHEGSFSVKNLAVTGIDVMEVLGIAPGPRVGEVLRFLLDRVLEEGHDFNQRETLLAVIAHGFQDMRKAVRENSLDR
jgi:tRNA nucleotidyltransferase (CCA-adding enzyme)